MSPTRFTLLLLLTIAQIGLTLAAAPAKKINFRCITVSGSIESIAYSDAEENIQIGAHSHARSANYSLHASKKVNFYALGTDLKSASAQPLATVSLPQKASEILFVFIPVHEPKAGEPSYRVVAIDDSAKKFPNGTVQFINLTESKLFLLVGQEDKTTKITSLPAKPVAYKMAPDFKGNLPIKAAVKNKKQLELIFNSRLFPNKNCRELCFIWPRHGVTRGNKLRTTALRDKAMPQDMQASPKQKPASR